MKNLFLLSLALVFFGGCMAGSGEGLDENGSPIDVNPPEAEPPEIEPPEIEPPETGEAEITLGQLVDEIFNNSALGGQRCANCHGGGSPLGGMNLETLELAAANLLGADEEGVPANGNASYLRVDPGNPDDSYIVLKLEGDSRAGSQMPLGQSPLTVDQIALVRDWIANGAPINSSNPSATKVSRSVVQKTSANSATLNLRFSRDVQTNTFSDGAVQVYFTANGNEWLARAEDYQLVLSERELKITVPESDRPLDGFSVVINDESLSAIVDVNGRLLDGNNDEVDGGAFRYEYSF